MTKSASRLISSTFPPRSSIGYPLSLFTYDQGLKDKLNSALYVTSVGARSTSPADITFEYAEGNLSVRKTFHFDDSYVVKTDIEVVQNGAAIQAFPGMAIGFWRYGQCRQFCGQHYRLR